MKLKEIISCYVTRTYRCDRAGFQELTRKFQQRGNSFEQDWRKQQESAGKVVFQKGAVVALSSYSGPALQVRVVFEHDERTGQMTVSVGNSGFPFEPLLSKTRYAQLSASIHRFVQEQDANIEEAAPASR